MVSKISERKEVSERKNRKGEQGEVGEAIRARGRGEAEKGGKERAEQRSGPQVTTKGGTAAGKGEGGGRERREGKEKKRQGNKKCMPCRCRWRT